MAVLDTNFLIAISGQDTDALRFLEQLDDPVFVPDLVAIEFLTDLDAEPDRERALASLEAAFHILHGDRRWVLQAAALRNEVRGHGARIRRADFWIAAWARHLGTPVVTRDIRDFEALGVEAVSW